MPCPFTGPKILCAGTNFWSQPKNLNAFSASSKTFVLAQKTILLNANHQYVNKCLVWHKKFGPAKNILEPVKGQGIRSYCPNIYYALRIPRNKSETSPV